MSLKDNYSEIYNQMLDLRSRINKICDDLYYLPLDRRQERRKRSRKILADLDDILGMLNEIERIALE